MVAESFKQASKDPMFWAGRSAYGPDQVILHSHHHPHNHHHHHHHVWPDPGLLQHMPYISHFFTRAKFLENKIYTEKTRKLRFFALLWQNTQ